MAQLFANNAFSTLAAGISAGDASITLATGTGSRFPALSGSDVFDITLTQAGDETSWEVVRCTERTGDVLTVTRGVEGYAAAWSAGSKVEIRITAAWLNNPVKGPLTLTNTGTGNSFVVEDAASDSTPFVIDANGTVICGYSSARSSAVGGSTITPALQQVGGVANTAAMGVFGFNVNPGIHFARANGTFSSPTIAANGNIAGRVSAAAHDGTGYVETGNIRFEVDGIPGANDMPGRLVFSTTPEGGSAPVEAMRIDAAGVGQFHYGMAVGGSALGKIVIHTASNTKIAEIGASSFTGDGNILGVGTVSPGTALVFGTAGAERMRIDAAGNVGIGVSPSTARLQTYASAGAHAATFYSNGYGVAIPSTANYGLTFSGNLSGGVAEENVVYGSSGGGLWFSSWDGATRTERVKLDSTGNLVVTSPAGLGYGTGAGGTVTQATSKNTAVTLNKPSGSITTAADALAGNTVVSFTFNNSLISNTDTLSLGWHENGMSGNSFQCWSMCTSGKAYIYIRNISGGSLTQSLSLNFAIIKGATA